MTTITTGLTSTAFGYVHCGRKTYDRLALGYYVRRVKLPPNSTVYQGEEADAHISVR